MIGRRIQCYFIALSFYIVPYVSSSAYPSSSPSSPLPRNLISERVFVPSRIDLFGGTANEIIETLLSGVLSLLKFDPSGRLVPEPRIRCTNLTFAKSDCPFLANSLSPRFANTVALPGAHDATKTDLSMLPHADEEAEQHKDKDAKNDG